MSNQTELAVVVSGVSKWFRLPHERTSSIKSLIFSFFRGGRTYETQKVLNDVSFEVKKGEFFGIVGRNGSGKSTMLKLLAGIYTPNEGVVQVNGRLTPFIELGVGFNPELTGRENVYLNGALLGFTHKEMQGMYQEIVDFAELENFMDQRLKNYSSGMQVRLAFSIAIRAQSDILLIDEVLAVGDAAFQTKCFDYFQDLKKQGATVIFVSHDIGALERFCERGVLINNGKLIKAGPISQVLRAYSSIVLSELEGSVDNADKHLEKKRPTTATSYAEIIHTRTQGSDGISKKKFTFGDDVYARFEVKVKKELINPILGLTIWQKNVDKAIFATNTLIEGDKKTGRYKIGDHIRFSIKLPPGLNDGEYYLEPAVANESATLFFDQKPKAATFYISGSQNPHSLLSAVEHLELRKL